MHQRDIVAQLRNVTRYFGYLNCFQALDNVNLEIRRGEIFGLVGAAGSGKSTALRIFAGRLRPSAGKVAVFGRRPRRRAVKARLGYLPQNSGPNRTGLLARFAAAFSGLTGQPFHGKQPLSSQANGPARAVLWKQILIKQPSLILLDDPFLGLDSAGSGELIESVRSVARRSGTVIVATRSLGEATELCDRVGVMVKGKIEAMGTIEELLALPDNLGFLCGVLPPATAQRVLDVIREEMNGSGSSEQTGVEGCQDKKPIVGVVPPRENATAGASMAALAKVATPVPSREPKPGSKPEVNHGLLARLTKRQTEN